MTPLTRRELFRLSAVGAASASGWLDALAAHAGASPPAAPKRAKRCVLLWMDGGPSHHDTFDMKPDAPAEYRGEFSPVASSVPGLQVTETFPRVAKLMHHAAVVRGMSTGESEHGRARTYLHTGYKAGAGGIDYPTMGSLLTASGEPGDAEMPNFVVTGMHLNPATWSYVASPGHLGPRHAPLIVADSAGGVPNLKPGVPDAEFADRVAVLDKMTSGFLRDRPVPAAAAQATAYRRAVQLMRSPKARAFDLGAEPPKVREAYGDHAFGQGCLLARRLVEVGVPFVEVYHSPTPGGWDSHEGKRAKEVKTLAMPQLDQGMSALLTDLSDRGLLDSTLVVWMGEFGRTPKMKADGGRDHYSRAWTTVLAGGGVKGGAVVGRTDKTGATVEDRPVSAADFMATICHALGVDADAEFNVAGRPVRAVEKRANPLTELF
ncbi:DUF1501 domain-containing protein [Gemmata sp.]|uniref:DUF1501 domain-containing protein n=1 Tax=Gemmata sp. TaxID=1914242 RepID=UPI003F70051D